MHISYSFSSLICAQPIWSVTISFSLPPLKPNWPFWCSLHIPSVVPSQSLCTDTPSAWNILTLDLHIVSRGFILASFRLLIKYAPLGKGFPDHLPRMSSPTPYSLPYYVLSFLKTWTLYWTITFVQRTVHIIVVQLVNFDKRSHLCSYSSRSRIKILATPQNSTHQAHVLLNILASKTISFASF